MLARSTTREPPAAPLGAVLAGGASTRFGTPKGLARVGRERMIDRVARALGEVAAEVVLVANDAGAPAWLPGVRVLADALPGAGGLSGVHAVLAQASRPVLVVAWDMPFVSPALLRELWQRCGVSDAPACLPESDSPMGLEPFCACYAPSCLPALERAIRSGNAGGGGARFVRSLQHAIVIPAVEVAAFGDPARMFFSVNTPDDLARAEAMAARAL